MEISFYKWHCLSQKYNDIIVFVKSVGNDSGGNENLYSNWDGYGNKTKITRNENGNGNYLIVTGRNGSTN